MTTNDDLQRIQNDLQAEIQAQKESIKRPTILLCGYTGTGKSSLISAICGKDILSGKSIVPESAIGHGQPATEDYIFYQNEFVRFWDSKGLEPGKQESEFIKNTQKFVRARQNDPNVENHIHLVWYCIQGCGARVTDTDKKLIQEIFPNVIVLITKNDITDDDQRQSMRSVLEKEGIDAKRILFCSKKDSESLRALVHLSKELLPDAFQDAWVKAQLVDLDLKKIKAQAIIHPASLAASAAGGLNPIPLSDTLLITPIQTGMIVGLSFLYGFPSESIMSMALPVVARTAGIATATSFAKFIPGFGQFTQAGVAMAFTEAIGQLTNAYLISCFEARFLGKPMPPWVVTLKTLAAEVLKHLAKTKSK